MTDSIDPFDTPNLSAADVAKIATFGSMFAQDDVEGTSLARVGIFAIVLSKAVEDGDFDRVADLVNGEIDLDAVAQEAFESRTPEEQDKARATVAGFQVIAGLAQA